MQHPIEECIERYEQHVTQERRMSAHTRAAYLRDIRAFLGADTMSGLDSIAAIRPFHVNQYVFQLKREGRAASSISRLVASIRSFCHFASAKDGWTLIRRSGWSGRSRKRSLLRFCRRRIPNGCFVCRILRRSKASAIAPCWRRCMRLECACRS